jgi:hypothetical protein
VCIDSIALWIRLYDLPPVMMKEAVAKQLCGKIGEFIKMDACFPGYMRDRVNFPLSKALVPKLKIKIKGKGIMVIKVRYENVPHFCCTCGCMGHAALNCEEEEADDHEIKFGEDLRASPPKRSREITVTQAVIRVVRPLSHAGVYSPRVVGSTKERRAGCSAQDEGTATSANGQAMHGKDVAQELAAGVNDLHVEENLARDNHADSMHYRKERVSFGTNTTTDDESSDNGSNMKIELKPTTAVERFQTRKFEERGTVKRKDLS